MNRRISNDNSTSRSLIARVKNDDSQAWEQLVRLYAPLVYRWCGDAGLSNHDRADVFQEVFRSVALNVGKFRKTRPTDTFRGWLRTITRNKVLDFFRRTARQPQAVGGTDAQVRLNQFAEFDCVCDDESTRSDQSAERLLFRRAVESIRSHFHEQTWKAFWKVVVEGKTPQDVAEELAMKPGAVRVAKSRVLQRLRLELGDITE